MKDHAIITQQFPLPAVFHNAFFNVLAIINLKSINKNSAQGYVALGKNHVTSSDDALYLYQVMPKYLLGFQSYGLGQYGQRYDGHKC